MAATHLSNNIRYEPDENPPLSVAIGTGIQSALVNLGGIVLGAVIVFRIAGQPESYIPWAIFAALIVSGISTILQAVRFWRIACRPSARNGHIRRFHRSLRQRPCRGGPATMASLIVISSLFQFLLASRLSLLRRLFTPVVSGTVIMLIAVTVMTIVFDTLNDVPEGAAPIAAPAAALSTLIVVALLILRAPSRGAFDLPLLESS